jgi:ABC-type glycerol-3-phosphate transport system permease component
MAAASMAVVPALLAYVVAERYVLESFVTAGLKESAPLVLQRRRG